MSYYIKPNGIEAAVKPDDIAYFGKNCEALYYEMDGIIEIYKGGKYLGDIVCQPEDWGLILDGVNPIEDGWEDGCGNTLSYDGWGECAMNESRFSSKRNRKPLRESKRLSVSRKSRRLNEFNFASDYDEDLSENPEMLFDIFKEYLEETLDGDIPASEEGSIMPGDHDAYKINLAKIKSACELFMKKYLPGFYGKMYYEDGKDYIEVNLNNLETDYLWENLEADFSDYSYMDEEDGKKYFYVSGTAYGWYKLSDYLGIEGSRWDHPLRKCLEKTWIKVFGNLDGEIVKSDVPYFKAAFTYKGENYTLDSLELHTDKVEFEFDE